MNSFHRFSIFFLFYLSIFILGQGCGESNDIVETDEELIPYFELFAQEGASRGIVVNYDSARIEGLIQDIPRSEVLGQCYKNTKKPRKVVVDRETWGESDEARRQFLIFHELGHCFLDRDHFDASDADGVCRSIMHSTLQTCNFELTDDNRDYYLDELFGI